MSAGIVGMAEVLKEGVLEYQKKKKLSSGKKWSVVYVVLTPGGLHIFKDENVRSQMLPATRNSITHTRYYQDMFPSKSLSLEVASPDAADKTKNFSFGFKIAGKVVLLAGDSDAGNHDEFALFD